MKLPMEEISQECFSATWLTCIRYQAFAQIPPFGQGAHRAHYAHIQKECMKYRLKPIQSDKGGFLRV